MAKNNEVKQAFDNAVAEPKAQSFLDKCKSTVHEAGLNVKKFYYEKKVEHENKVERGFDKAMMINPLPVAVHKIHKLSKNFEKNGGYSQFHAPENLGDAFQQWQESVKSPNQKKLDAIKKELGDIASAKSGAQMESAAPSLA